MKNDSMLALYLREPSSVDGGELLLGLHAVVEDGVNLREGVHLGEAGDAASRLDVLVICGVGRVQLCLDISVLGGEGRGVGVSLGLCLCDGVHAAALIEPGGDATGELAVALGRLHGGGTGDVGLLVELLHCGLACGELLLDLAPLVSADAGEVFIDVVELVGVELKLRLCDVEVIGAGRVCALGGSGKGVEFLLVVLDDSLQVGDLLLEFESFASKVAGLERCLAQGLGEGLVDLVIGETLGFADEALLFSGDGEWGEGFDGLPGPLIDGVVVCAALHASLAAEEGKVGHGVAGEVDADETCEEEDGRNSDGESAQRLHLSTLHCLKGGLQRTLKVGKRIFSVTLDIPLMGLVYNHKVIKLMGYGMQFGGTMAQQLDTTFAALADPTRRAILARLVQGEASVQELAAPFAMSQPAISKHLRVLERAGLISRGRDAQRRPCRLEAKPLAEANEWLERYRECWEQNFQRLDALLEELKAQDGRGKAVKTRQKRRTHAQR